MKRKKLTIGLFGLGVVGQGLFEVLQQTPALNTSIRRICVKNLHKDRVSGVQLLTIEPNDILLDPEINVVVELIDDADAAYEIVKKALLAGKAVVTANKKMLAEHFEELLQLQLKTKTPLLYEAAVCASIPVIRNLEEYYDTDLLESVEGIVNGSTNYILSQMLKQQLSYSVALEDARKKGYAESNPLLDVGGFDAKYKLILIIAHAFGLILKPDEVFNRGIDQLGNLEFKWARDRGYRIKLVAEAAKNQQGEIIAYVMPKFLPLDDKLATVDDVFNGIKTRTVLSDTQFFSGKGAGAYPTASAVISDISALTYGYRYEYKKKASTERIALENEVVLKVLIRFDKQYFKYFQQVLIQQEEAYVNGSEAYLIGYLSLETLRRISKPDNPECSVVLIERIEEYQPLWEREITHSILADPAELQVQ